VASDGRRSLVPTGGDVERFGARSPR
jgi:hypothetical protein